MSTRRKIFENSRAVAFDGKLMEESAPSVRSAICASSRLPAQVFRSDYVTFHFLDFDLFDSSQLKALLQLLMNSSNDQTVSLVVLDPDPQESRRRNFKRFDTFKVAVGASAKQYMSGPGPESSLAESMGYDSWVLVWAPPPAMAHLGRA